MSTKIFPGFVGHLCRPPPHKPPLRQSTKEQFTAVVCDVDVKRDWTVANSHVCPLSSSSPTLRCLKRPRFRLVPVAVAVEVLEPKPNFADVGKVHVDSFMVRYRRQQCTYHDCYLWIVENSIAANGQLKTETTPNFNFRPEFWQFEKVKWCYFEFLHTWTVCFR